MSLLLYLIMQYTSGISHLQEQSSKIPEMTRLSDNFYIDWNKQLGAGAYG